MMRKQYYLLLLVGFIIAAGVMFTGCPETETTWTFENHTWYDIQVESPDLSPSSFVLAKYTGNEDQLLLPGTGNNPPVDTKTATSTKSSPKIGYTGKGQNQTWTENNIKMVQSDTTIRFEKKVESGFANIKLAE